MSGLLIDVERGVNKIYNTILCCFFRYADNAMKTAEMAVAQNFLSDASRKLPIVRRTQREKYNNKTIKNKTAERVEWLDAIYCLHYRNCVHEITPAPALGIDSFMQWIRMQSSQHKNNIHNSV